MHPPASFLPEQSLQELIERGVANAVSTPDLDEFLQGFRGMLGTLSAAAGRPLDAESVRIVGTMLGRAIWSGTPAPRNDFRPKPLPEPGRNEPCVCGSGIKYKRCCGRGPALPSIPLAELWPFALDGMSPAERKLAFASGQVPLESLGRFADQAYEAGQYRTVIDLLEPLFAPSGFAGVDERFDDALNLLCNAYDAVGQERKKLALLERVRSEAPRSPLRSGAFQRIATIALGEGDSPRAWAAFREAQRDDPDSPSLGMLEVQLLTFEHRVDEARERAKFWRTRMLRLRDPALDRTIEFLTSIAEDPTATIAGVMIESGGGAGRRLQSALRGLEARPLPDYTLASVDALEPDSDPLRAMAARLRGMGVAEGQIDSIARDLLAQLEDIESAEGEGEGGAGAEAGEQAEFDLGEPVDVGSRIVTPPAIARLEADWHAIYPVGKPFSVQVAPSADLDPWSPSLEDRWMSFIERHPEAFDSIDILDDLTCAVELHPQGGGLASLGALQRPLVERAVGIMRRALDGARAQKSNNPMTGTSLGTSLTLSWVDTANRPALRCVYVAQALAVARGDSGAARELAGLLLELNPGDNHGVRAGLMNLLLRDGQDEAALALADRFENDLHAEISYGRVLALVRLGRAGEAAAAARRAVEQLPEVRRYLMRERARQPELSEFGVRIGGKDQAWLYREEMRGVWLGSPEAMALIKRTK